LNLDEAVLYRLAYALADQLREARGYDCQRCRFRSNASAGGPLEAIVAEVLRRLSVADRGGTEVVREAVDDVMEGRPPRW